MVPVASVPFEFPDTFYVIASLLGLEDGTHAVALLPEKGVLEFGSEEQPFTARLGLAVVVLPVVGCVAFRDGLHTVTVAIDGRPLEPAFAFAVRTEETE
jgi:hypothetical protein